MIKRGSQGFSLTHQSHNLDTASVTVRFQSEAAWDTHHTFSEWRFQQELRFAGVTKGSLGFRVINY